MEREKIVKFNRVLVDTSFLFGIFDKADQYHERSVVVLEALHTRRTKIVLAWPVLYETVNTGFLKDGHLGGFKRFLDDPETELIDDQPYRKYALESIRNNMKLERSDKKKSESSVFSLVDQMLRLMMKHSDDARIGGLVTFDGALNAWGHCCKLDVLYTSNGQVHWGKGS